MRLPSFIPPTPPMPAPGKGRMPELNRAELRGPDQVSAYVEISFRLVKNIRFEILEWGGDLLNADPVFHFRNFRCTQTPSGPAKSGLHFAALQHGKFLISV